MRTYFVTVVLFLGITLPIISQESEKITFPASLALLDVSNVDISGTRSHPFGIEFTKKMTLIQDRYTRIEPATATSPVPKTSIIKPVVYNSVKKINKYFIKGVKKSGFDKKESSETLSLCLDVALIAYAKNTSLLEAQIKNAKTIEEMVVVYKNVVLEK